MSVPDWANSLPAELQATEIVKSTPDLATAVKRLVDLDRYKGASIALPKDGDAESQKAFTEAITKRGFIAGEVPADPAGYDVEVDLAKVGLDATWKTGRLKDYHAMGLTKAQAKSALSREVDGMAAAMKAITDKHGDAGMEAIRKASSKYNLNGDPAGVLNLLLELGTNMNEDGTKPAGGAGGGQMSLNDIDVKITETDEEIRKLPLYDPRSDKLLATKFELLKQRTALTTGDKGALEATFDSVAKNIGRR